MNALFRFARTGLAAGLFVLLAIPAAHAVDVQKVTSPGGIEAWLVRDEKNPIIAIDFAFDGGTALDPADKLGLATMTGALLDEGAGELDSQSFQKRLEDNSISLSFSADRDHFYGSVTTLKETKQTALDLLRLAITAPRFDQDTVDRIRQQMIAGLRRSLSDPGYVAQVAFADLLYPDHPYGKPSRGTPETLANITVDDLRGLVKSRFGKDRLHIAVAGDITPAELETALDTVFGALPAQSAPFDIQDVAPKGAGETLGVSRPIPQTIMVMGHRGIRRDDPDWFPATVLNYVLGGGGFSSRLMDEVREQRGLTYGVSSSLQPFEHSSLVVVGGSTSNDKAAEAIALIKEIWQRTADKGITAQELEDAKTYLTGSYPLQFTSNDRIASILLAVMLDDLGIDYINRRNELVNAVTLADVNRVAKRLLDPAQLATVVVGQPEGLALTRNGS